MPDINFISPASFYSFVDKKKRGMHMEKRTSLFSKWCAKEYHFIIYWNWKVLVLIVIKSWLMLIQWIWPLISLLSFSIISLICHVELYKIIVEENIEYDFPNCFSIFLKLTVTNCTAERSFSTLKYIKNINRKNICQDRLDALSLLSTKPNLLR